MGIPLTPPAAQTPPAGDQANAVVSGVFSAIGASLPLQVYGTFNVAIWGSVATTITTSAGSATATVGAGTSIAVGQAVNIPQVPPGTTVGAISSTTVTLAFAPGHTSAEVTAGSAVAISFPLVAVVATINLERTFDGGATWLTCGVGGSGASASYVNPTCTSISLGECEKGVAYRLNCVSFGSGTVNYRMSATGHMAISLGALTV